jgi:hypothetical protein
MVSFRLVEWSNLEKSRCQNQLAAFLIEFQAFKVQTSRPGFRLSAVETDASSEHIPLGELLQADVEAIKSAAAHSPSQFASSTEASHHDRNN